MTVDGVAAVVSSWTATTIVAVAPPASAFYSKPTGPVDVAVVDLSTGGSTVMSAALSYAASVAPDVMTLVSAPSGTVAVGTVAAAPFAVRVFLGDGVTPVVGVPVAFMVSAGAGMASAQFGACGAASCVVLTDATGLASTGVTADSVRHCYGAGVGCGRYAECDVQRGFAQHCGVAIGGVCGGGRDGRVDPAGDG